MDSLELMKEQLQRPIRDRYALGKQLRKKVSRSSHGEWAPASDRPDPLDLLQAQDKGRIQNLLPIKYGRMAASPFAFLRGSAVVMAGDLAATPATGQYAVICGDAHISNFGLFASPERKLVFDVNDFDECYYGPWEWDLKRLVASVVVAGRERPFRDQTDRDFAALAARVYRDAMRRFAGMPALKLWYFQIGAKDVQMVFKQKASKKAGKMTRKSIDKALSRTQARTLAKLTHLENGRRYINHEPPLLVPLRETAEYKMLQELGGALAGLSKDDLLKSWQDYLDTLPEERRVFLERYKITDIALRVGGVGSVGMPCFILLLEGAGKEDGLILQLKAAVESVLESYLPRRDYEQQAQRVVIGQRIMQAASDPFLGWNRGTLSGRDYYWRQLKDMKGSIDVARMDDTGFGTYVALCALSLARAHARSGDPALMAGYLGKGQAFDRALAEFAVAYADQTEKDHAALLKAIEDGHVAAQQGI